MTEILQSADTVLLLFLNVTISNPVGDWLWPVITHYDRFLAVRIGLIALWVWLLVRGGARGRAAAILIVPVIVAADQLSSTVLKELIARPRPCHLVGGVPVVEGLRMLVDCGPGKSFPSSHAVNNFAAATVFAHSYPRLRWWLFSGASMVALSRPAVGVHYPSDILGGALIGAGIAMVFLLLWSAGSTWYSGRGEAKTSSGEET